MSRWPSDIDDVDPAAIKNCLDYLYMVLMYERMTFPALLVGAAALALEEMQEDRREEGNGEDADRDPPANVWRLEDHKRRKPLP